MSNTTIRRNPERVEFLRDIITTAIEGGIGYWSACSHYQWIDRDEKIMVTVGSPNDRTDAYAVIHELKDDAEDDYKDEGVEINIDVIAKGIGVIKSDDCNIRQDSADHIKRASQENDGGEIDADDADLIVQAALFGRIVYG